MSSSGSRTRKRFTIDSLFEDTRQQATGARDLIDAKVIDLDRIHPDPLQPRRSFDPERLAELAESIRLEGVLQPIAVRFDPEQDRFVIIHGERRWRAAKIAGLPAIPAIVRDVSAGRRLVQQLMENVLRDDLNAIDRAAALRELRGQLGDPAWEVVADAVGIKRSRLFQLLGTGKLSAEAQEDIQSGRLSEKQSRALQGLSPSKQAALRELILSENVPATAAMRLSRAFRAAPDVPDDDIEGARASLEKVRAFVLASNVDELRKQTTVLLSATRQAARKSGVSHGQLKRLASTVDAESFRSDRLHEQVNALARSLATMQDADRVEMSATLRELNDTLAEILAASHATPEG